MHCLDKTCNSTDLYAHVQASVAIPLTQRGGSVNLKGFVVKQSDVKDWWDLENGQPRLIRGPIICANCGAEHVYLKGLSPALRLMSYADAVELGYDHFAATSEASSDDE